MKKLALSLAVIFSTATVVSASEPLILEPLSPEVLNGTKYVDTVNPNEIQVNTVDGMEATFVPNVPENMVPQNAAAEGKPVPKRRMPRVNIVTKQGRQSNVQWNPGGKGTKAFF